MKIEASYPSGFQRLFLPGSLDSVRDSVTPSFWALLALGAVLPVPTLLALEAANVTSIIPRMWAESTQTALLLPLPFATLVLKDLTVTCE